MTKDLSWGNFTAQLRQLLHLRINISPLDCRWLDPSFNGSKPNPRSLKPRKGGLRIAFDKSFYG
jgi:hypothetical protein